MLRNAQSIALSEMVAKCTARKRIHARLCCSLQRLLRPFLDAIRGHLGRKPEWEDAVATGDSQLVTRFQAYSALRERLLAEIPQMRPNIEAALARSRHTSAAPRRRSKQRSSGGTAAAEDIMNANRVSLPRSTANKRAQKVHEFQHQRMKQALADIAEEVAGDVAARDASDAEPAVTAAAAVAADADSSAVPPSNMAGASGQNVPAMPVCDIYTTGFGEQPAHSPDSSVDVAKPSTQPAARMHSLQASAPQTPGSADTAASTPPAANAAPLADGQRSGMDRLSSAAGQVTGADGGRGSGEGPTGPGSGRAKAALLRAAQYKKRQLSGSDAEGPQAGQDSKNAIKLVEVQGKTIGGVSYEHVDASAAAAGESKLIETGSMPVRTYRQAWENDGLAAFADSAGNYHGGTYSMHDASFSSSFQRALQQSDSAAAERRAPTVVAPRSEAGHAQEQTRACDELRSATAQVHAAGGSSGPAAAAHAGHSAAAQPGGPAGAATLAQHTLALQQHAAALQAHSAELAAARAALQEHTGELALHRAALQRHQDALADAADLHSFVRSVGQASPGGSVSAANSLDGGTVDELNASWAELQARLVAKHAEPGSADGTDNLLSKDGAAALSN